MASWPTYMVTFENPRWQVDALTSATPLTNLKHDFGFPLPSYLDLFVGNRGGCIGEVCVAALLVGALFLLYKNYISWKIPLTLKQPSPQKSVQSPGHEQKSSLEEQ